MGGEGHFAWTYSSYQGARFADSVKRNIYVTILGKTDHSVQKVLVFYIQNVALPLLHST